MIAFIYHFLDIMILAISSDVNDIHHESCQVTQSKNLRTKKNSESLHHVHIFNQNFKSVFHALPFTFLLQSSQY
jgi:hypothetical protein